MTEEEFQNFTAEATDQLRARVNRAQEVFGIGEYERFELDLTTGRIWWSDEEIAKVEAKLIVVGSISTVSNTWLWGWANPHLDGVEIEEIERVKAFGEEHSLEKLTERKWPADEIDGWEMTAVAARLLETEAAYRSPSRTGFREGVDAWACRLGIVPVDEKILDQADCNKTRSAHHRAKP